MPLTPERYTALLRSCEPSVVDLPVDKQQVLSCEGFLRAQCHMFNQVCCYEEGLFQDLQTMVVNILFVIILINNIVHV